MSDNTPLLAQVLKRASRLSLSGAARTLLMLRAPDSAKRRSTLLLTPAPKRHSLLGSYSQYQAQSQTGQTGQTGQTQSQSQQYGTYGYSQLSQHSQNSQVSQVSQYSAGFGRRKDLRPLRDKNYQQLILREILDFLQTNDFDKELGIRSLERLLVQPTQREFVLMFQFLYGKLDPGYTFGPSTESDVFVLLKALNYPYLDGITRSTISAVGGRSWPTFLGILYWLVKLNLLLLGLDEEALFVPEDPIDHILLRFAFSSYRSFLAKSDDYSEQYSEMERSYDLVNAKILGDCDDRRKEGEILKLELRTLTAQHDEIQEARVKFEALENDIKLYSAYLKKMEARKLMWGDNLKQLHDELADATAQLRTLEDAKQLATAEVEQKGFSIQDIDKLSQDKERLSRAMESVSNRTNDIYESLMEKEVELRQCLQSLESFVGHYNLMLLLLALVKEEGYDYELAVNPALLLDAATAFEQADVLNKLLTDVKIKLFAYRDELNSQSRHILDETARLSEQADLFSEKIFEQQETIYDLEAKVAKNKAAQDEIHETMSSNTTILSTQVEKLELDVRSMKASVEQGVVETETLLNNRKMAYGEWKHNTKQNRELLHDSVHRLIGYVISFKLQVQKSVEELEDLALEELEKEEALET